MATHYYFAYGSNMAEAVFGGRVQGVAAGCGVLRDYRLSFTLPSKRWNGYAADLSALDGAEVWGRLWQISDDQLKTLDAVEANYRRIEVTVEWMNQPDDGLRPKQISAMTYVVRNEMRAPEDGAPETEYLNHLLTGAEECELPAHYIQFLRASSKSPGGSLRVVGTSDDAPSAHG